MTAATVSQGRRMSDLAALHPDKVAIIDVASDGSERSITWSGLDSTTNQLARLLVDEAPLAPGALLSVALGNSLEHYLFSIAAWKLGAGVLPLNPRMPRPERDAILATARPLLSIGEGALSEVDLLQRAHGLSPAPLPDRTPKPGRAIASGGSTGTPKVIVHTQPLEAVPGESIPSDVLGLRSGQVQLVCGGLFHNLAFTYSHYGLFEDHQLVVMTKFNAGLAVDLIERHRVNFTPIVPTMMARILQEPGLEQRDLSSWDAVFHSGAICPPNVKRAFIDLLGAEHIYEAYGTTEGIGAAAIRGDEWLLHPQSVGRPFMCEMVIRDDAGVACMPGVVGEIYSRPEPGGGRVFTYLGDGPPLPGDDEFMSAGDLGWFDEDGYLYIADRRVDLIITGGANVYPAEVEAALGPHPRVADVAVIGLPDPDWGKRVHAVVEPIDPADPPRPDDLIAHCRALLAPHKVPKSVEFVAGLPRNEAGKLRRSDLVTERSSHASATSP